jgi:hypothetical protein
MVISEDIERMSLTSADKQYFEELITKIALKTATSTHFKESCGDYWDKKAKALADVTTGKDISTTRGKAEIREIVESAKSDMEKKKLVGRTIVIKAVEVIVIFIAVYIGMKVK